MELFVMNRYVPPSDASSKIENNEDELRQQLLSKISERKRKKDELQSADKSFEDLDASADVSEPKKKKRKKKKKEMESAVAEEPEPAKPFMVLGKDNFSSREKVKRVLPYWLKNPNIVSVDLKNLTHTVDAIPKLDKKLLETLRANKITHFFPVQAQVIPWLLDRINRPSMYWPNDVCVSAPTGSGKTLAFALPIIQSLQSRLTVRIRALVVLPVQDLAKQVYKVFCTYSAHTDLKVILLSNSTKFQEEQKRLVKTDKLNGCRSQVDIVVTTPGRLVDHIQQTAGFSLKELKYLVIDEADRVMENVQNDWLYHVNTHLGLHSGTSKSFQVPPLCLRTLETEKRPPQKLLFSATLSQDPEKLHQLGLFQPVLFTSVIKSREDEANGTDQAVDTEKGDFVGKFTTPAELSEAFVVCSATTKPLVLLQLIESRGWNNVLVFTKSCESTHRLAMLLKGLGRGKMKVAEISAKCSALRRSKRIQQFSAGVLQVMISSDALARGIDIPSVQCVISYDAPKYIKNYVHRIGRTGRAGNQGTAISLLLPTELDHFNKMMETGGKTEIEKLDIEEKDLEAYTEHYQAALLTVKKKLDIRKAISTRALKIRQGVSKHKKKVSKK